MVAVVLADAVAVCSDPTSIRALQVRAVCATSGRPAKPLHCKSTCQWTPRARRSSVAIFESEPPSARFAALSAEGRYALWPAEVGWRFDTAPPVLCFEAASSSAQLRRRLHESWRNLQVSWCFLAGECSVLGRTVQDQARLACLRPSVNLLAGKELGPRVRP